MAGVISGWFDCSLKFDVAKKSPSEVRKDLQNSGYSKTRQQQLINAYSFFYEHYTSKLRAPLCEGNVQEAFGFGNGFAKYLMYVKSKRATKIVDAKGQTVRVFEPLAVKTVLEMFTGGIVLYLCFKYRHC